MSALTFSEEQQLRKALADASASARREALASTQSLMDFLVARGFAWLWNRLANLGRQAWEYVKTLFD